MKIHIENSPLSLSFLSLSLRWSSMHFFHLFRMHTAIELSFKHTQYTKHGRTLKNHEKQYWQITNENDRFPPLSGQIWIYLPVLNRFCSFNILFGFCSFGLFFFSTMHTLMKRDSFFFRGSSLFFFFFFFFFKKSPCFYALFSFFVCVYSLYCSRQTNKDDRAMQKRKLFVVVVVNELLLRLLLIQTSPTSGWRMDMQVHMLEEVEQR